jgi:type II secretory pathway component GspD/PulD (secretin)
LNAIVVHGSPEQLETIKATIARMDEAGPVKPAPAAQPQIKIFSLKNADVNKMLTITQTIFTGDPSLRISADARTNMLIVQGKPEQIAKMEAILLRLDEVPTPKPEKTP